MDGGQPSGSNPKDQEEEMPEGVFLDPADLVPANEQGDVDDGDMEDDMTGDDDGNDEEAADLLDDSALKYGGEGGHADAVYWCDLQPGTGDLLVSAGGDDQVGVWETASGTLRGMLKGHTDSVIWSAFNMSGSMIGSASMDGTVKIWSAADGNLIKTLEGPSEELLWASWHPKGDVIVAGSQDCCAWMWSATNGSLMGTFVGHGGAVTSGGFSNDGKWVYTTSEDGTARVWAPRTSQSVIAQQGGSFHEGPVLCSDLAASLLVTGGDDGNVIVTALNLNEGQPASKVVSKFEMEAPVECVTVTQTGNLAVAGCGDGVLSVIDLTVQQQRCQMQHENGVTSVVTHPLAEHLIFSTSADKTLRLWDARTGGAVTVLRGHKEMLHHVCLDAQRQRFVTCADDGMLLFNMTND